MKAIIVYRRMNPYSEGSEIVEEENIKRTVEKLQKNKIEIICILHISFALRVRYVEFPQAVVSVQSHNEVKRK